MMRPFWLKRRYHSSAGQSQLAEAATTDSSGTTQPAPDPSASGAASPAAMAATNAGPASHGGVVTAHAAPDQPRSGSALSGELDRDVAAIRCAVHQASDLVVRSLELAVGSSGTTRGAVLYLDGLADKDIVHQCVIVPLLKAQPQQLAEGPLLDLLERRILTASGIQQVSGLEAIVGGLLDSRTILLIEGEPTGLAVTSEGWEHRNVSSPKTEPLVRGPQDAFNEVLRVNTALLRRKLKDARLTLDPILVGARTRTEGIVAYLQDVAHPGIVTEVKRRIEAVDTEGVLDSGQLEEFLEDNPYSPFPQISSTERADKAAAALLEGKVLVFVDGSPFVLLMPVTFPEFLMSSEDYYGKYTSATMLRWVRFLAVLMALLLPSIYIALSTFHQEMLPTQLMIAIAANRSGLPFPAFFEALIMEISLELLREASLRLPGGMGQTIGVVGALVIGQAAVQANIVGPVLTIIVSFTAIGTFVIPNYSASISIRLLRFPLMLLAAVFGIFGIVFGAASILIHMVHLRSFGVSYLSSITPQTLADLDDSFLFKKINPLLSYRLSFLGRLKRQMPGGRSRKHGRSAP
ncbi:spore germination protein [Paenibacillus athensensis]|nr:spore germination protein [Paenibacillus athensensis]